MKRKWILIIVIFILVLLFVPMPTGTYKDGGTKTYSALTYKIVKWNRLIEDGVYEKTRVYFLAKRYKSLEELWEKEMVGDDSRYMKYAGEWLDKDTAERCDDNILSELIITEIYADCFFAEPVIASPNKVKLNGTLSDEWCVGDQVNCTYENTYYDQETHRIEVDFLTVEAGEFTPDANVAYKPVIYFYPEKEMEISVKLELSGKLTCTYPSYQDGWKVIASPEGILTDTKGQTYNYLYWEGETYVQYDLSKGFCVRGEETAQFLESALAQLGLNRREANEFIVYWLPLMECNAYNIISFQDDVYTNAAKLEVNPAPDTVIRVFMAWQESDTFVEMEEQVLSGSQREGFTVVEWGGTQIEQE